MSFAAIHAMAQVRDHACLIDLITWYVDAVVAHDPFKLPMAEKVQFTEDSKALKLGEGLWKTVTPRKVISQKVESPLDSPDECLLQVFGDSQVHKREIQRPNGPAQLLK